MVKLGSAIGGLVNLTDLDLEGNALERLPAAIGALACLECLRLDGNRLTSLESVSSLTSLVELSVARNQLVRLLNVVRVAAVPAS